MSNTDIFSHLVSLARPLLAENENLRVLCIADENIDPSNLASLKNFPELTLISNRFTIIEEAKQQELNAHFSDFDFSELTDTFDICIYQISKERAVCHHVFNQCLKLLNEDGKLILGGKKSEGVKGYLQKLVKTQNYKGTLKKDSDTYCGVLTKGSSLADNIEQYFLDDKNYSELRTVELKGGNKNSTLSEENLIKGLTVTSKPGLYGWDKVDQGSLLLMDTVIKDINETRYRPQSALDLGCGFGYLALRLLDQIQIDDSLNCFSKITALTATDNNAAAVTVCEKNIAAHPHAKNIETQVFADNCGNSINGTVNLIVCNPPFHQGFENSRELTQQFLQATSRLLSRKGVAYFVVNTFIPLESLAPEIFKKVLTLTDNRSFKVILLSNH